MLKLSSNKIEPLFITAVNIAARFTHLLFFIAIGNKYGSTELTDSVIFLLAPLVVLTAIVTGAADAVAMPVFHKARDHNDAKYIYIFFVKKIIKYILPASILIVFASSIFYKGVNFVLIIILFSVPIFTSLAALKMGILNASSRFRVAVSGPLFGSIAAIFFLWITPIHIYSFALSFLIFEIAKTLGLYLFKDISYNGYPKKTDFSDKIIVWGYRNAKLQLVASFILALIYPIDIWFAQTLDIVGSITFIEYSNKLWNIIPLFFSGHIAFTYAILSKAASNSNEAINQINVHRIALRYLLFGTIAAGIVISVSDSLISLLFGFGKITIQQQSVLSDLLSSYLIGAGFYVGGLVYVRMMSAAGRTDILLAIACLSLLFNIFFDAILIRTFGLNGIGLATSIVYFCNFFIFAFFYSRRKSI